MALIKCIECKKEISTEAKFCPHCGCENSCIFCPDCGEQLNNKITTCPKCGRPLKKSLNDIPQNKENEKINGVCLAGLILAIISFIIDPFALFSLTAFILSIVGINLTQASKNSKAIATIGIFLSTIEIIYKIYQLVNFINL